VSSPVFQCRNDYHLPSEVVLTIMAPNPRKAAEEYCFYRNNSTAEYPLEQTVIVRAPDEDGLPGTETTWVVELRTVPEYTARQPKSAKKESDP
jgi:hypothetical protein